MNKKRVLIIIILILLLFTACNETSKDEKSPEEEKSQEEEKALDQEEVLDQETTQGDQEDEKKLPSLEEIRDRYEDQVPVEWGERVTGVKTRIDTEERIVALTFDACGGPNGRGYDEELIEVLIEMDIPATLFISGDWMEQHSQRVLELWEKPNFDIANHGKDHKPLSVNGKSAYGIPGTDSVEEVYQEVYENHLKIKALTGDSPKFFRSGTAYYDEVAVKIIKDLGEIPVNYNVLGDAGATFSAAQIYESMMQAKPGSIMLFHMNHPHSDVAEGVKIGIEALLEEGFEFVLLKDYMEELE